MAEKGVWGSLELMLEGAQEWRAPPTSAAAGHPGVDPLPGSCCPPVELMSHPGADYILAFPLLLVALVLYLSS